MKEEWKDIPGYEGLYQASSEGRIRSLDRVVNDSLGRVFKRKGRILKPRAHKRKSGRLRLKLSKENTITEYYVHTLIALTFIGVRPEGYDIDHINTNPIDNRINNLEYVTKQENRDRYMNSDKFSKLVANDRLFTSNQIKQIRKDHKRSKYTYAELANMYGCNRKTIENICRFKSYKSI